MQKKNLLLLCACTLVSASTLYAAQDPETKPAGDSEVVNLGCTTPPSPDIKRVVRKKRTQPKPPKLPKQKVQAEPAQPAAEPAQPRVKPASYAAAAAPHLYTSESGDDTDAKLTAEQAEQAEQAKQAPEAGAASVENPEGPEADAGKKADGRRVWRTWFGATRESRVIYSLNTSDLDAAAAEYLTSQNGRHEVGRELDRATQELAAAGLTPETASLVRLVTILNKGHDQNVSINLADLKNAHAKIKKVKGEVTSNLNNKLAQALTQFLANINQEFAAETALIARLACLQHKAAQMRCSLADDPENESDNEDAPKEWNQAQVFEQLTGINAPHRTTTLGVEISLNEPMQEID